MATTELGSGKTVIVLAVVVGCFGVLWPRVFYPMMQTVFMATKPKGLEGGIEEAAVCCDVIYENNMDLKFFAELCHSVLESEATAGGGGGARYGRRWRGNSPPPPGTLQRCRQKILELCDLDINELMAKNKANKYTVKNYRIETPPPLPPQDETPKMNLSHCLEKHFQYGGDTTVRKPLKETALPSHMRQERPPRMGPHGGHPALMERGQPYPTQKKTSNTNQGSRTSGIRPSLGAKPDAKGGGAMGFLMPIYTVGIIVFFLYTIAKVLLKKTQEEDSSHSEPKVNNFHMDPEYRKYVLSEQYHQGLAISYEDYLKLKEEKQLDEQDERLATKLLKNGGKKQVFTAIEGIIAEMDEFRERILADQPAPNLAQEDENHLEDEDVNELYTAHEDLTEEKSPSQIEGPLSELAEHLKNLIQQDKAKISVMGLETQAGFPTQTDTLPPPETEVSSIMLEKAVPSESTLLVAESQCLTHTSVDHIDGWSEADDDNKPVIVTGKMTISLLGNEQAAVLNANQTEQAEHNSTTPTQEEKDDNQQEEQTTDEQLIKELNGDAHISS